MHMFYPIKPYDTLWEMVERSEGMGKSMSLVFPS